MQKFIETTGKNEDEAINKALTQLGLDRDEVSVEIVERAKSGFLGIGGNPAKVRVTYEGPDEPVAEVKPAPAAKPTPAPRAAAPKAEAPKSAAPMAVPATGERAEQIVTFLTGLMEKMDVAATPVVTITEEGNYKVDLAGENLGALIGRRGETLDAIQQLTSYTVNKGHASRVRIHVDCENYRAKREESLERLAQKVAGKVVKYRRNVTLEPMNAYERHVIHTALQEYPDVSTYSTGTEPNRRTVVAYSKGEHRN
ncbi:MAG: protein jag [Clostridia bacterium]|nr:protein jag [Clostridia bacterium]